MSPDATSGDGAPSPDAAPGDGGDARDERSGAAGDVRDERSGVAGDARDERSGVAGDARDERSGVAGDARDDTLTHLDATGTARMVDVGDKDVTARTAVARARLTMAPRTAALLAAGDLPKGDALAQARIAGMMAAKRTWELLPLCHQVALTSVEVELDVDVEAATCDVVATARAADRTGVEMEAMVAATTAALAVYDMVKAVQRDVVIGDIAVVRKEGGRSGTWELDG